MADTVMKCAEDEIELMEILLVLWNNKVLIIVGTLVCIILGAIVSSTLPKLYQVQMKIQIRHFNDYIDDYGEGLAHIKMLVDTGQYDEQIASQLSTLGLKQISGDVNFNKVLLSNTNSFIVSIDVGVSDEKSGKEVLQCIYSILSKSIEDITIGKTINIIDENIQIAQEKLDKNSLQKKSKF